MIYPLKTVMFVLLLVAISFEGCYTKVYPDQRLAINANFLSLFNSIIRKDTIRFNSSNGVNKIFIITKVDSIISNRKAWFINEAPYKLLRSTFKEIGKDTVHLERENEIFVNKNALKNQNSIVIKFNNLFFDDTILPLLHNDTLTLNAKRFINYYSFETSLG